MLAAERAFFDCERKTIYPFAPAPPEPKQKSDIVDTVKQARKKKNNRIDKYFILSTYPRKSAGYGHQGGHGSHGQASHEEREPHGHAPHEEREPHGHAAHEGHVSQQRHQKNANASRTTLSRWDSHGFDLMRIYQDDKFNDNDNNERGGGVGGGDPGHIQKSLDEQVHFEAGEVNRHGWNVKKSTISAFKKAPKDTSIQNRDSKDSDSNRLRFRPHLSRVKGINLHRNPAEADVNLAQPPSKKLNKESRPKKLIQSQITSVDRLTRSKWRRDPIHDRLLFLTGHTSQQIQDPDYVKHMDNILKTKHNEKDGQQTASLAGVERDREWLWSVKYDLDFSKMETASLEQHRVERKEAAEAELNRQDAMFSSAGKQTFYTIATRTHGLDQMRNVKALRQMHQDNMKDNIRKGIANPRCTWLLHAFENEDADIASFLKAETASELYLGSESVVKDAATIEDLEEEEEEKSEEEGKKS